MKLRQLLDYNEIVIQCHDNPDADSLACGFGVYRYLQSHGKQPRLIYGGNAYIRKSNLRLLIRDMEMPVEHVNYLEKPELLVMVDCQYEGGNVTVFSAENVAVIDHHRVCTDLPALSEVNCHLGACATLVWKLLLEEKYDLENDRKLFTALYYGLYTDTNGFAEIVHPMDMDLRDEVNVDTALISKYRNANLSLEELEVAGAALLHSDYIDEYRAAIVKSGPCDPNILGIISDLVLEVDAVDICIVFNVLPDMVKLSVRSCVKEVKANELAAELCEGIGSGGGHYEKAGGTIQMRLLKDAYLEFCNRGGFAPRMELDETGRIEQPAASGVKAILEQRMRDYLADTEIVYIGDCRNIKSGMKSYHMKPIPWSYVKATDLFASGTPITIRTLNGDAELIVLEDTMLIIGAGGGVHWCSEKEFTEQFRVYKDWNRLIREAEYVPRIKNNLEGKFVSPEEFAKICVPKESNRFSAKSLEQKMKLFDNPDSLSYRLGRKGDYLVNDSNSEQAIAIVEKEVFESMFEPEEAGANRSKKAVIFDLDGTLLDTLEDLMEAVNHGLSSQGLPTCSMEQVRAYVGNGIRKLMARAVPEGEQNPKFAQTFAEFQSYYALHCMDHTKPYEQIMFLLEELYAQHIPVAIVSNKIDFAVRELKDKFFGKYVQAAVGETEGLERKPSKDMVMKALSQLGAAPENAIYVGDSEVDLLTAQNSGLPCVSVTWGFKSEEFLREQGAKTLIHSPAELLYLL